MKKIFSIIYIGLLLISASFGNLAHADEGAAQGQIDSTLKNLKADIKLERYLKKYGPDLGIESISLGVTINRFSQKQFQIDSISTCKINFISPENVLH